MNETSGASESPSPASISEAEVDASAAARTSSAAAADPAESVDTPDSQRPRPRYEDRASNAAIQWSRIRTIGWMIFLGPLLMLMARMYAARVYMGTFSIDANRIDDLGARTCGSLPMEIPAVEICSPGFFVFNGSLLATGVLMLTASLMCEQLRMGITRLHPLLDARVTRLIGVWGVAVGLSGLAPLDIMPWVHEVMLGLVYLSAWSTLVVTFIVIVGARAAHGVKAAGWAFIVTTALMLFFSIVSAMMFLVAITGASGGIFQRISLDTLALWLQFYGLTVVLTGSKRFTKYFMKD
ncbi:hypothetical protein CCICO_01755 [Corynebacterium ciconiae DSM 44920]|uniref:DUF998 domain-containing protein n=1 Tax=Corynebacterium ciconiae TaxID=227319 RepID=UPI00036E2595|nr:DUF998 domain-containing protein [Corynebacterium ciconiae]WKD60403.1 hypothetical protein CCICO_01755 [Corynebacterium ciconiae DSM 44920]